jgi:hypothetical protein
MKNTRTRPRSRHILVNTLAGLFLGIGVSLMMTLYGVVSWSTTTPNLIIVLGVVLGLGVGLLPVRTLRDPVARPAEPIGSPSFGPSSPMAATPVRGSR